VKKVNWLQGLREGLILLAIVVLCLGLAWLAIVQTMHEAGKATSADVGAGIAVIALAFVIAAIGFWWVPAASSIAATEGRSTGSTFTPMRRYVRIAARGQAVIATSARGQSLRSHLGACCRTAGYGTLAVAAVMTVSICSRVKSCPSETSPIRHTCIMMSVSCCWTAMNLSTLVGPP
jgi:hypothetical protein